MKKSRLIILIFVMLLVLPLNVDAAGLCTSKKLSDLKMKAYNSELVYELKFDDYHNSYFLVTIYNVDKDVLLIFNSSIYLPDSNGKIAIETALQGGNNYEFKMYGGYDTDCVEEFLYKKTIKIPKYNVYSEREECIEYEEFPLCNKWYSGEISGDEFFLKQLNAYIDSLKKTEPEKKEEIVEKNIFEKIIDFYVKYIVICLPITIIIVGVVVFFIVRRLIRRKNRVKIKFEE